MKARFKIKKLFGDKEIKDLRQFLNTFPIINKSLSLTSLSHYKLLYEIIFSEKIFNFIEETFNDDVFFLLILVTKFTFFFDRHKIPTSVLKFIGFNF